MNTALRLRTARGLSIVGHPALLVPGAVAAAAWVHGAPPPLLQAAVAAAAFVAMAVLAFSAVQVRRGRWRHVDGSAPQERRQLNAFLALLLLGCAGALWWAGQPRAVPAGLAIGGALVLGLQGLHRWGKVSLHAAFAVFAALLLWPAAPAVAALLVLAGGVAWSRLVLHRHTPAEVAAGLASGAAAGLAFQWLLR